VRRRRLGVTVGFALFCAALVATTVGTGSAPAPALAAPEWPFPDDDSLPLVVDDAHAGRELRYGRIVVTTTAPFLIEVAAYTHTRRFLGGMIALWDLNDPTHAFFTATTTLTSPTRVRVASDTVGFDTDTEPLRSDGNVVLPTRGTLEPGTYQLVMLVGAEDDNESTLFRIHAGPGVSAAGRTFGRALIAGEEMFAGAANATAAESNAIVGGTVHWSVTHALTGVFITPEASGVAVGPDGAQPVVSQAKFVGARAGSYDFTVVGGVDPAQGGSPSAVLVADVPLA